MVQKEELSFKSRDGETNIHAIRWIPEGEPRAILQIVHGMQEYIDRYDEFARFLAERGILVTGNDHLGHGQSIPENGSYGYFCKYDAATVLVRDVHRLKKMNQEKYPGVPYIILGHSFGSFVTREYISRYGTGIDSVIIMGTGMTPGALIGVSKCLCKIQKLFLGDKHKAKMLNNIAFGTYLDKIDNPRTEFDWLSHNEADIDKYIANPANNFMFTVNGFSTMAELLSRVQNPKKMGRIPKELPILLIAGKEDPVGSYGAAVEQLYNIYKNELKIKSVELKLYDGLRHEILNEIGKEAVYEDLLNWINKRIEK